MGKIYETKITDFSGGITSEPRMEDLRYARMIKNFDAHTYPKKLVPYRDSENGDSSSTTSKKQNFCVALCKDLSDYALFALGVKSGETKAEILYKRLTTGNDNDLDDATWSTPSDNNHQSTNTFTWFDLFVYYKKTGLIYGARGSSATAGTTIWAFYPNAATAFVETSKAISDYSDVWGASTPNGTTFSSITQGLVHSKDDILYIGVDNCIIKNNNGTWSAGTSPSLVLPYHLKITSICEYGNYLAIGCAPRSGVGKSVVYLWDRDASLTTLSESIDWGEGVLQVLEEVDGYLVGISYVGSPTYGFGGKIIFRYYGGGKAQIFQKLISDTAYVPGDLPIAKQKVDNYLYFLLEITLNGDGHQGLWRVGRTGAGGTFAVSFDRTTNNDTAINSHYNFYIYGDYVFISYNNGSGVDSLSKTNDSSTAFTASSKYETLVLNGGDSSLTKKLISVGVMTEPLPADGSVVLKYKKDEDQNSSWATDGTTIFTNTTDDSIYHEAINIESSGATLPEFREIQFQIISTGKAVITGLKIKYEIIDKNPS